MSTSINLKNNTIYILLLASLVLYACQSGQQEDSAADNDIQKPNQQEMAEGFQLLENSCFSCHSPNASFENPIAPTIAAIKLHYIENNTSQEQFTSDLISFLNDPIEENARMPDAIKRFNLMPKTNINEAQVSKIATYLYHTDLQKSDWFENHYQAEKQKHKSKSALSPIEAGQKIAMKTKGVLGKNLLHALNSKGTEKALAFCSTKALPLTDSMAVALNARIKRVSDKNRNPENKANEAESAYIKATTLAMAQGEKPKPQLTTIGDKHVGYYPIITNKMCLQCHGQPETDVSTTTLSKIATLYPDDLAIGYKANELRGIWVVEMDKN